MSKTIVAIFQDVAQAHAAVQQLMNSGFSRDQIALMVNPGQSAQIAHQQYHEEVQTVADLTGALIAAGIPHTDAHSYFHSVQQGDCLVVVTTTEHASERATHILQHTPTDTLPAGASKTLDFYPADETSQAHTKDASVPTHTPPERASEVVAETIPVVEEQLHIRKRQVARGGVRVNSYVIETPVEESVQLRDERLQVERRPIDRPAEAADLDQFREGSFEIAETAEELVVDKQARVVEEVHISKDVDQRIETVRDSVRQTAVDIEPVERERAVGESGFAAHEGDFRDHFQRNLPAGRYTYEQFAPIYRYGYTLGSNPRNGDWSKVEPQVRQRWEERNPGTWERVKTVVQYAWERARGV